MTFQVTTKDATTGQPVAGILIRATDLERGLSWPRSSDGSGYSDLAIIDAHGWVQVGDDVLIEVLKDGYATWTGTYKVTAENQQVAVALVPFVG